MALIATPGASNADSYATLVEADAYFDTHLYSTVWSAAVDATQERALKMATRLLDAFFRWTGSPSSSTQALRWPRVGMARDGFGVDSTTIPPEIRNATSEFAQYLLSADTTAPNDIAAQGITRIKLSTLELQFKDVIESKVIPDAVLLMIPLEWYEGGIDTSNEIIFNVLP